VDEMRTCLADGYPFVFGFTVYSTFESGEVAKSRILHLPKRNEQVEGGHAVMAVGYNESKRRFLVRNSWNTDWALKDILPCPMPTYPTETFATIFGRSAGLRRAESFFDEEKHDAAR
jgi:hypothetical protein